MPVVLLHGLLSTPREFGLIALPTRAAGVPLVTPHIEGYSEASRRHPRTWRQWLEAARDAVRASVPRDQPFVLGGLCSGALIAAALAASDDFRVEVLILMSPSFDFNGWGQTRLRHWRRLGYVLPVTRWVSIRERTPFGIKNERLRQWVQCDLRQRAKSAAGPSRLPLWAIRETEALKAHVVSRLSELPNRSVVMHAREDDVCSFEGAVEAFQGMPSTQKTLITLENSFHMITLDNDRKQVADEVIRASWSGTGIAVHRAAP